MSMQLFLIHIICCMNSFVLHFDIRYTRVGPEGVSNNKVPLYFSNLILKIKVGLIKVKVTNYQKMVKSIKTFVYFQNVDYFLKSYALSQ